MIDYRCAACGYEFSLSDQSDGVIDPAKVHRCEAASPAQDASSPAIAGVPGNQPKGGA